MQLIQFSKYYFQNTIIAVRFSFKRLVEDKHRSWLDASTKRFVSGALGWVLVFTDKINFWTLRFHAVMQRRV